MPDNIASTHSALLVMDLQNRMVGMVEASGPLLGSIDAAIKTARNAEIPVIYVAVRFREGFPEISPHNKSFSAIKQNKMPMTEVDHEAQIHQAVAPMTGDIVVNKRRVSAFTGSDLEVVLSGLGVRRLVLCGISTSGVVLSTTREAADKDFEIVVLSDGCADSDPEVHRVLLTKVLARQADVMTVEQWSAAPNGG